MKNIRAILEEELWALYDGEELLYTDGGFVSLGDAYDYANINGYKITSIEGLED